MPTIIDLLDDLIGDGCSVARIQQLTKPELDHLADEVAQLYTGEQDPPSGDDSLRFYSGGWVARNFYGDLASHLRTSLVYSPAVVIHDPVAEWFNPDRANLRGLPGLPSAQRNSAGDPAMTIGGDEVTNLRSGGYFVSTDPVAESRAFLAEVLPHLYELAPLVQAGVIVPIDELGLMQRLEPELHAAVDRDVRDRELYDLIRDLNEAGTPPTRSNFIRGAEITPDGGFAPGNERRAVIQNSAFYFEKTLAIAAESNARYVAPVGPVRVTRRLTATESN